MKKIQGVFSKWAIFGRGKWSARGPPYWHISTPPLAAFSTASVAVAPHDDDNTVMKKAIRECRDHDRIMETTDHIRKRLCWTPAGSLILVYANLLFDLDINKPPQSLIANVTERKITVQTTLLNQHLRVRRRPIPGNHLPLQHNLQKMNPVRYQSPCILLR